MTADLIRLRFDIAYDGTDFAGWAKQPGLRTVQGELEQALAVLLRTEQVRLTVGGRTDAGVHARGQVAHLDVAPDQFARWQGRGVVAKRISNEAELRARRLNGVLKRSAPDIQVHTVREVPQAFDARFSALQRRYEYRLRGEGSRRDPLTARFTADVPRRLDLAAMQRVSAELLGLQDFTTFCKAREGSTAVRELLMFEWRELSDGALAATIQADAFCHSMVRALVGSVVAVGSGKFSEGDLIELRDARERTSAFTVMPAHGLSLEEISYPEDHELAARADLTRARRAAMPLGERRDGIEEGS